MNRVFSSKTAAWAVVAAAAAAWLPLNAQAIPISFQQGDINGYTGTQDTFLESDTPTINHGQTTTMQAGTYGSDLMHALLRFDVSALAGSTINGATLTLYIDVNGFHPTTGTKLALYQIASANAGWVEGSGNGVAALAGEPDWDYKSAPSTQWAGGADGYNGLSEANVDYVSTPVADILVPNTAGQAITFTLPASLVQTWVNGDNAGLLIRNEVEDTTKEALVQLATAQYGTVSDRPLLSIEYSVPEPVGGALLLVGGAILALRRKRC